MIRIFFIILFAILGLVAVYVAAYLAGLLFGPLYQSEADMTRNLFVYLCASVVFFVLGGVLGNYIYKKCLTRR